MKQDKDWIDVMRSSLRDAEPAPPSGGWERLERELGTVKPHTSAWRIYWPRIAAAAAVLLCIVAGELLLHENHGVMTDGNVIVPMADGGGNSADNTFKQEPALVVQAGETGDMIAAMTATESSSRIVGQSRIRTSATNAYAGTETVSAAVEVNDATAGVVEPAETEASSEGREPAVAKSVETSATEATSAALRPKPAQRATPGSNLRNAYGDDLFADDAPRRKKTSLGLFAGGGMIGGTEAATPGRILSGATIPGTNGEIVMEQRYNYADYSFRHHLPLSFGLAVRKDFSHGLSLESGVSYTLLMSDVGVRNGTKDITQKLHFIGVPVRFNWRFFERNRFSLYIGAGGMVEKCVAAKFGSRSVDAPKVQWSAFAAAGAQYRLGGVVALYFEPEVSYYFTETALRTARTDSPMTFTLRLGVRFTF